MHLGCIALNRIQRLVKNGPLNLLEVEPSPQGESSLESKMTKRLFGSKCNSAKGLLELVLGDVCGFMNVKARGGYK